MKSTFWSKLALPYSRLELPGWGKLLTLLGVFDHDLWRDAPDVTVRGKFHGYRMRLSLKSWSERQTYFLGRYYELDTQLTIMNCLRPGDTFVDVGGNVGMVTLVASRRVGPRGAVHTFEPNPEAAAHLTRAIYDNQIRNITLHPVGLSDQASTLTLSVITDHLGMGTFAEPDADQGHLVSARHTADVVCGDDVLPPDLPGEVTVKIDVEGFECRAVRGLLETIRRHRPAIVTEVIAAHLHRAGNRVADLFDLLQAEGYRPYLVSIARRFLRPRLSLTLITTPDESMLCNVAWLHPGGPHESRLREFIDA